MSRNKSRKDCLYCGGTVALTKEHVFPDTIGGVRWYRGVCQSCNNGVLSALDSELCTRSPLSLVAGSAMGDGIGWTWDVDDSEKGLLLEGRGDPSVGSMTQWPQMVFDDSGPQFHADHEAMLKHGLVRTVHEFIRSMRRAVSIYKVKGKGIYFRRFSHSSQLSKRYRYPPRIFVEHLPGDFRDDMTFIVGYTTDSDRRKLLHSIDQWDSDNRFKSREVRRGSDLPVVRNRWDHVLVLRALTKIGLNLVFDTVGRTEVSCTTFRAATEFVRKGEGPHPSFYSDCGFVRPADLSFMAHANGGHAFRLVHAGHRWKVMLSFFGGKLAAYVHFPGPSIEPWDCVQGSTPLRSPVRDVSKDWKVTFPKVVFPVTIHIECGDPQHIIPSLGLINTHNTMEIQQLSVKH